MNKMNCPFHKEKTDSLVLYDDHYHCFGCGAHGPLTDLGLEGKMIEKVEPGPPEDLEYTLARIQSLPTRNYRGLTSIHYDAAGSYIIYPNTGYYVFRSAGLASPKYRYPRGHSKPLFKAHEASNTGRLIVIEGQINALSLVEAGIDATIVSPGAATDFGKIKNLPYYCVFSNILLVLDNDAAGALGAIELKAQLIKFPNVKQVKIKLVDKDANDVLQEQGKEALKAEYQKALDEMGMS